MTSVSSSPFGSNKIMSRRGIFLLGSAALSLGATGLLSKATALPLTGGHPIQTSFDVTQAPFNADQTGKTDSSPAFQAALNAIQSLGLGELIIPGGHYRLESPLTCTDASVTIVGFGQECSILIVAHTMTALTITCNNVSQSVALRDFGMSPVVGGSGPAGTAISLIFPPGGAGWQRCSISDLDLGAAQPGYSAFMGGVSLTNGFRTNIRNLNGHSNIGNVPGSFFVALNGICVDTRIANSSIDGVDMAFMVNSYCEGLHITDTIAIGNTALWTGNKSYSGNGTSTPQINLLGLNVTGCEFNCYVCAAVLYQVYTGWIADTHLGTKSSQYGSVVSLGSTKVQFSSCSITGLFDKNNPQAFIGINILTAPGWNSSFLSIDDCTFTNLTCGMYFGPGTYSCTASAVRMLAPGDSQLLNAPLQVGNISVRAQVDDSGNFSNFAQLFGTSDGPQISDKSNRVQYSKP